TAILERFTAPLCEAVTEMAGAAGTIDMLERENLFIVALDENRQWFRYHHLFAQVLRSQLALREPALVPELHRRASAWHRLCGGVAEAIEHSLAAGDVPEAVELIAGQWYPYVNAGRMETVRRWINALGDEMVSANPLAAHSAAWVAALAGEPETVRRLVRVIEAAGYTGPLPDGMRSLKSSAALLRGAFGFDGLRVMRESAAMAAELETDPRSPWCMLAQATLGFSLYLSGDPGAAEPVRRAVRGEASGPLTRCVALCAAAMASAEDGRLGHAEALANAARRIADDNGLDKAPQASLAGTVAGIVRYRQGRLEEARCELERALRARRAWLGLSPWPTLEILLQLAAVLIDLDDRAGAAGLLAEATDVLTGLPDGADHLWARLTSLQRRLSGAPGGAVPADELTQRERMVLRLLRGTLTLGEVAQELGMSSNTIKTHTRAIYRKLGVPDRHGAVARARDLGLL
ncbi:MAG: hypothetical protein JO242_16760, partial [Streptosporangiaceae bacterium]|nr:hypothetical protein [Streptosporangiaceae bacterium]